MIYSKSRDEHEQHLHLALYLLRSHLLYAKLSKSEFWMEKVTFLGHVTSKEGVSIDPSRIEVVLAKNNECHGD